jgi:hypothetical protein
MLDAPHLAILVRWNGIWRHYYNNNNNQAFYSQASWGKLEMKPHEKKTGTKQERKRREKIKGDKKPNKKKEKRQ